MAERFHGTLNKLIAKIISKGKLGRSGVHGTLFHKVYPMRVQWVISICAYARVGAKHSVTITVQAWVQTELGEIDLQDWILENVERLDSLRDRAVEMYQAKTKQRKETWDVKAKERSFSVDDEVLVRKPGMGVKLEESWEGPYKVTSLHRRGRRLKMNKSTYSITCR